MSQRPPNTMLDLVEDSLRRHKYDGLYCSEAGCACTLDDLFPCGEGFSVLCQPGHRVRHVRDDEHSCLSWDGKECKGCVVGENGEFIGRELKTPDDSPQRIHLTAKKFREIIG